MARPGPPVPPPGPAGLSRSRLTSLVHDPVKARLVELWFFAGLTLEQAADCLDISPSNADRAWRYARDWLSAAMAGDDSEEK